MGELARPWIGFVDFPTENMQRMNTLLAYALITLANLVITDRPSHSHTGPSALVHLSTLFCIHTRTHDTIVYQRRLIPCVYIRRVRLCGSDSLRSSPKLDIT